jgi:hypothetical protein
MTFAWLAAFCNVPGAPRHELYDELVRLANLRPAPGPGQTSLPGTYADTRMRIYVPKFRQP